MPETDEDPEWLPRYSRDFEIFDSDHWYKWWYGGKRKSTVQERILTLETRQRVLFDLVLCESHNRLRTFVTDECELFRKKAEQVFGVPAKGSPSADDAKIKPPNTTSAPQTTQTIETTQTTQAAQTTAIVPQETTTVRQEVTTPTISTETTTLASSSSAPIVTTPAAA